MKFNIGDSVKFLNDTGKGVITGFPDTRTAMVMNEDGFEVPVLITELIPAEGAGDGSWLDGDMKEESVPSADKSNVSGKSPEAPAIPVATEKMERDMDTLPSRESDEAVEEIHWKDNTLPGVFLAWVAGRTTSDHSLYLVNDSPLYLLYLVQHRKEDGTYRLIKAGKLEPDTKIRLGVFPGKPFKSLKEVRASVLVFHPSAGVPGLPPLHGSLSTEGMKAAVELMFRENEFFGQPAWMVALAPEKPAPEARSMSLEEWQEKKRKEDVYKTEKTALSPPGKISAGEMEEVDLHIESIVEQSENLEPAEIIEIQKSRFVTALEGGIRSQVKKMVFIHGVGDGKLKYEIRRIIDRQYPRLRYQDASFREYGYGATMVIFP